MFISHVFYVNKDGKNSEGPGLGTGDIHKLKEIFPNHPIWKCRTSDLGNQYYPTNDEVKAFYDSLVEYYAANDISDAVYSTSGMHPEVVSNLVSVFDDVIAFFEKECGFKKSESTEKIIAEKQERRQKAIAEAKVAQEKELLDYFGTLPDFKRPEDMELIARLNAKRFVYEKRIADCNMHPDMAKYCRPDYRANCYKRDVLMAILENERVKPKELVASAIKKYGNSLNSWQFLEACAVIAHYINQPIPGIEFKNGPPPLPEPLTTAL